MHLRKVLEVGNPVWTTELSKLPSGTTNLTNGKNFPDTFVVSKGKWVLTIYHFNPGQKESRLTSVYTLELVNGTFNVTFEVTGSRAYIAIQTATQTSIGQEFEFALDKVKRLLNLD